MGYKLCEKNKKTKLSENFDSTEFDCHGKGCCSQTKINEDLIEIVQKIRNHFGKPITVSSGYRCENHNRNVGGAVGSRHSKGDAADIVVKGVAPREVAKYAEEIGVLGIGLYETDSDGYFTHVDTRSVKSFWYGQAQAKRTTFCGVPNLEDNKGSSNTSSAIIILSRGDTGNAVKELQEKLIKLGYSCGVYGADGDFGKSTEQAVIKFQKNHSGLAVDGIVGYQTLKAIDNELNSVIKTVRVNVNALNVRSGAGTNYPIVSVVRKNEVYSISEEKNGWGKLYTPNGWISLKYCTYIR